MLETLANIVSDAKRGRADTVAILEAVNAGTALAAGMSREKAVEILTGNIADYNSIIARSDLRR